MKKERLNISKDPKIKDLEELLQINLYLSSTLELKELLGRILSVSQRVLCAEASSVLLLDETSQELTFEQALGEKAHNLSPVKVKVGEGIAGKVAETGEPILIADVTEDPAFTGEVDALTGFTTKSMLCVPMKIKDRVIGVLELLNKIDSFKDCLSNKDIARNKNADYYECAANNKGAVSSKNTVNDRSVAGNNIAAFNEEDLARALAVAHVAAVAVENARLYEEKAKHLEEIKRLEKIKGEFLSVISHELRTPLVPIKGYVSLLHRGEQKLDSRARLEYLGEIMNQTDHLARLIEDLFLALDLEEVNYKLELEEISLLELLRDVVKLRRVPKNTHPIKISISSEIASLDETTSSNKAIPSHEASASAKFLLKADKSRMGHAFLHIIDNAVKFSPKGGAINCLIKQGEKPYCFEVVIEDQGVGIPKDSLSRIFDIFYQADSSSTRKFGGTGTGLYIAKKIIEAHGGKIWAESQEGKGSSFHVLLA